SSRTTGDWPPRSSHQPATACPVPGSETTRAGKACGSGTAWFAGLTRSDPTDQHAAAPATSAAIRTARRTRPVRRNTVPWAAASLVGHGAREEATARGERLAANQDLDRPLITHREGIDGRDDVGAQEDLDPVRLQEPAHHEGLGLVADARQLL